MANWCLPEVVAAGSDEADDPVLLTAQGGIRIVTLNRPHKRNAAGFDLQARLLARVREVAADRQARALVLAGAGPVFCAGGDRDDLQASIEGRLPNEAAFAALQQTLAEVMTELPIPSVAAVRGAAAGFGAAMASLCDFVVMGEDAAIWDPHALYGRSPCLALSVIWPRLAGPEVAHDLLSTGRRLKAAEALHHAIAHRVAPPGEELAAAISLAEELATLAPSELAASRLGMNRPSVADMTMSALSAGLPDSQTASG